MKHYFLILTLYFSFIGYNQQGETIFGFQYKPIVPNKYIGEYTNRFDSLPVFQSSTKQSFGYSLGMVFRHYFTKKVALESGINFTKRTFKLFYEVADSGYIANNSVSFINYQIPIKGVFYIQLTDDIFMNASMGLNFDFFPSYVSKTTLININSRFGFKGERTNWVQLGANANFGFEYRTKKKGTFYIGATYNQPFGNIMNFKMKWEYNQSSTTVEKTIKGSYLTIDLRYYLPVNKNKAKKGVKDKK